MTLGAALAVAACGEKQKPVPTACTDGPAAITAALRAAPGAVTLPDGTRLSECVSRSFNDAQIQGIGIAFTGAADALAGPADRDARAALRLGYLVGAVRRGAAHSNGIQDELVRRVDQAVGLDGPPAATAAAYARGIRAGVAGG